MRATAPIYHYTHMSNVAGIIASNGLFCDRACSLAGVNVRGVAYSDLKVKRSRVRVEAGPGQYLDYYAPFYFGPRAPMLLPYKNGKVTGRVENQDEIVYLVSSTEAVVALGLAFAFTDGHPVREPRAFYASLDRLDQVDFSIMFLEYWNDTDQFPDRLRRRQAEFLVWHALPWSGVLTLGVRTEAMVQWVAGQIENLPHKPVIEVHPEWYYDN